LGEARFENKTEAKGSSYSASGFEKKNTPVYCRLPAEIAVLLLVEFIRLPNLSFEQLPAIITRYRNTTAETKKAHVLL
jgi:hypothetical protein